MGWACSRNGHECIWDIGGMSEGNGPLGRPRSRWLDNIEKVRSYIDWIDLDVDMDQLGAVVKTVINFLVP
jgi:hypothetical protein